LNARGGAVNRWERRMKGSTTKVSGLIWRKERCWLEGEFTYENDIDLWDGGGESEKGKGNRWVMRLRRGETGSDQSEGLMGNKLRWLMYERRLACGAALWREVFGEESSQPVISDWR